MSTRTDSRRSLPVAAVWAVALLVVIAPPARAAAEEAKPPKELAATVKLPDGRPAAGAEAVFTFDPDGPSVFANFAPEWRGKELTTAKTGADGRFVLVPPPGARAEFAGAVVHDAGYAVVYAADGFPRSGVVTLAPWGRVEGVALRAGKPPPRDESSVTTVEFPERDTGGKATVNLSDADTPGADGRFALRARPGVVGVRFTVRGKPPAVYSVTRYVEAEAGKAVRLDFGHGGRPVVGKLVAPAGAELPVRPGVLQACTLSARQPDPPRFERYSYEGRKRIDRGSAAQHAFEAAWRNGDEGRAYFRGYVSFGFALEADGSFRIEDVPPGEYVLKIELAPLQPTGTGGEPVLKLEKAVSVSKAEVSVESPLDLGALEPDVFERPGL